MYDVWCRRVCVVGYLIVWRCCALASIGVPLATLQSVSDESYAALIQKQRHRMAIVPHVWMRAAAKLQCHIANDENAPYEYQGKQTTDAWLLRELWSDHLKTFWTMGMMAQALVDYCARDMAAAIKRLDEVEPHIAHANVGLPINGQHFTQSTPSIG